MVISAWRSENFIEAAVASALDQELPDGWDIEVLVVADGRESDYTASPSRPKVTRFLLQENRGPYVTLNTALRHARGEAIAILDADDVCVPGRLKAQIEFLDQNSEIGIVGCFYQNTDESLQPKGTSRRGPFNTNKAFERSRDPSVFPAHGTWCVRRCVYDDLVGPYAAWRCAGDWEFMVRAMRAGVGVRQLRCVGLLRRRHASQLTVRETTGVGSSLRERLRAEILNAASGKSRRERAPWEISRIDRVSARRTLAIVPSIPGRKATLRRLVATLRTQVDGAVVYLNGHTKRPPLPGFVRSELHPTGTGPEIRLLTRTDGYAHVLLLDDDLVIPQDYAARTVAALDTLHGSFLTWHGSWWERGEPRFVRRSAITYSEGSQVPVVVTYPGSGVSAFHERDFARIGAAPAEYHREDDVYLAIRAAELGLRIIRPPSGARWIRAANAQGPSIYRAAREDGFRRRDALLQRAFSAGRWSPFPS